MSTTVHPTWQGFLWLSRRECHRVLRLWTQTTLAPVVSSLLFIVVFGLSLGGRISVIQGYEYEQFIVPGLIAMAMAQAAYSNNASTIFQGRNDRFIDDVLAAPIHHWQVNVGYLIGGAFRALIIGVGLAASPSRSPAPRSSTPPCCSSRSSFSSAASAPSARSSDLRRDLRSTPASSTTS